MKTTLAVTTLSLLLAASLAFGQDKQAKGAGVPPPRARTSSNRIARCATTRTAPKPR